MKILNVKWLYVCVQLNILALCVALLGGFAMQFWLSEIPCPLCYLQRVAMMVCAVGLASIVLAARQGPLQWAEIANAYGVVSLAAVMGACVSIRQILLHVVPPDPGFGTPVLGLHLYTWGLIVFASQIISAALILAFTHVPNSPTSLPFGSLQRTVLLLLVAVILGNLVLVFAAAGWNWNLPADPVRYLLFKS